MRLPEGYSEHRWQPDEVARFWDFISKTQPEAYFSHRVGRNIAWAHRRLLGAGRRIIDYGCGTGRFMEELLAYECLVSGYDLSSVSRQVSTERLCGRANFVGVLGPNDLAANAARFDVAFCLEVIEHLYDEQLEESLADVHALLAPGARLIVTTPNDEDLTANMICNPIAGTVFHRWQHVRSWSAGTLTTRLQASGFAVDRARALHAEGLGRQPADLAMRVGFATVRRKAARTLVVEAVRL